MPGQAELTRSHGGHTLARLPRLAHFRFYPSDFMNDPHVAVMDSEARGVYFGLLCAAWEMDRPGELPGQDSALMRLSRSTPEEWSRCKHAVSRCFDTSDGRWVQKRMAQEHAAQQAALAKYRIAGRKGGLKASENRKQGTNLSSLAIASLQHPYSGSQGSKVHKVQRDESKTNTPSPTPARARVRKARAYPENEHFQAFYDAYPRRIGRETAAKAFDAAMAKRPDWEPDDLIRAARAFTDKCRIEGKDPQYIPYPAVWLNQARFLEMEAGHVEINPRATRPVQR